MGIADVMGGRSKTSIPFDGTLPSGIVPLEVGEGEGDGGQKLSARRRESRRGDEREEHGEEGRGEEGENSDKEGSEKGAISMEGDPTLREWMKTAQVPFIT